MRIRYLISPLFNL